MSWKDLRWREGWLDWRSKRFWACLAVAVYALVGFVAVPWWLEAAIVDGIESELGATARLQDVDTNPFALSLWLEGFELDGADRSPMLKFDELYGNFELWSLFRWAWSFREVRLTNPFVRVVRERTGEVNLLALVPRTDDAVAAADAYDDSLVRLFFGRVAVFGGQAEVIDRAAAEPFETALGPIDVEVLDLSTLPERAGEQTVVIATEDGGRLQWIGSVGLRPLRSAGHASVQNVPLEEFSAYVPADVPLEIAQGKSDVSFFYTFAAGDDGFTATVTELALALKGLRLMVADGTETQKELTKLTELRLSDGHFQWPERKAGLAELALDGPDVSLWRAGDGRFVWEAMLPPSSSSAEAEAPAASGEAPAALPQAPWTVTLERFVVKGARLGFEDATVTPLATVAIEDLNLVVRDISLAPDAEFPFELDFDVAGGGRLDLAGELTVLPATRANAHLNVEGLALPLVQPYLRSVATVDVASGAIDLEGDLTSAPDEVVGFDGKLAVRELAVNGGADSRLVAWKRLALDGIKLSLGNALRTEIADVVLEAPYGRIHIAKDGTLNIEGVVKEDAPGKTPPDAQRDGDTEGAAAPEWSVKVGRFRLLDGETDFTDESLPIPFDIAIHSLDGTVSTLDTSSRDPAPIELEGEVGEFGLARSSGELQPFDPTRDTTIEARFENVAMPEASPYSIRFAGRRIASGRLDLTLRYRLDGGHLVGGHDIVLRDFAFGEKVESADALDLPFDLAVSLLKGPDGNIDVELPIEGDVDDPEFRLGGVIVKALVNLLTQIVTSPFRLLGNLVGLGDAEDLDRVAFLPGRSDLAPPEREKVAKLAEALAQRPQLVLEVPAVLNEEADAAALRKAQLDARVESAVAGGDQAARRNVLETLLAERLPNESTEALEERFAEPPSEDEEEGEEPVLDELAYLNELQRLLVESEPLEEGALERLAADRAATVRDGVLATAAIEPARVSVLPSQEVEAVEDGVIAMTLGVETL